MQARLTRKRAAFGNLSSAVFATTRLSKFLPNPYFLALLLPLLLGCGNINEDLFQAAAAEDSDAVAALVSEGADPSAALIVAVQAGRAAAVQPLLDNGADPSSRDLNGRTALMWAVESGSVEIVNALVNSGAAVNLEDTDGKTALAMAEEAGKVEIEQLLRLGLAVEFAAAGDSDAVTAMLSAGADPSVALMMAVQAGRAAAVQPLLDNGADPSSRDPNGRTALMWAAANGDTEVVDVLINVGVNIHVQDEAGQTAVALAEKAGWTEIARRLLAFCRVGQELKPGQSCGLSGGAIFKIQENGCIADVENLLERIPDDGSKVQLRMSGSGSLDLNSPPRSSLSFCVKGRTKIGEFVAEPKSDGLIWMIESIP